MTSRMTAGAFNYDGGHFVLIHYITLHYIKNDGGHFVLYLFS